MEKKDLRIVFMGTPEFAVETLKALVENEYNVHEVEVLIADRRLVQHVIPVVMLVELLAELLDTLDLVHR